ncbi:peptide deformylase [Nocardia sp. NBC_01009]|uniref:peptide deformylase n=1 Tax=Nocardia sp. NBC_01009 TaxID=2975996 RepID=UPI00386A07D5|nr:peptide deformylase [Nocardia sp. NBC_01009]
MIESTASEIMRELGIVQVGAAILGQSTKPLDLPNERDVATWIIDQLFAAMDKVSRVHTFAKGVGIAAPQLAIDRRVAAVRPAEPGAAAIILLNPRIVACSDEVDTQFEGCLSFFDVRGLVPRPLRITIETTNLDGETSTAEYANGMARLISHEIDHLDGVLYTALMDCGVAPIRVEEYRQTGRNWNYGP